MFFGDRVCTEAALARYKDLLRRSMDINKLGFERRKRRRTFRPPLPRKGGCAVGLAKQCVVKQG